ncbi:hypothetical protein EPN87_03105 [archaeon]|nr:MAG: hypothetical protein EPN87_03105 [archaeon]
MLATEEMSLYVSAVALNAEQLHASLVAGEIATGQAVWVDIPNNPEYGLFEKLSQETPSSRDLIVTEMVKASQMLGKNPTIDFNIRGEEYDIPGSMTVRKPYTGDDVKVRFGPFSQHRIPDAYTKLSAFMQEAGKGLLGNGRNAYNPHFRVTIEPDAKAFVSQECLDLKGLNSELVERDLRRANKIAVFETYGLDGYIGEMHELRKDGVLYGVLETRTHNTDMLTYNLHLLR